MYFCQTAAGPFQALTPWCLADQPFTLAVVVPSMRFGTRREFYGFSPPAHQEAKLQQHLKFRVDCKSSFLGGAGLKLRSVRSDPHNEHASHLQDFTVPPNSSPNEPVTSLPRLSLPPCPPVIRPQCLTIDCVPSSSEPTIRHGSRGAAS